jgi:hypothetical protein
MEQSKQYILIGNWEHKLEGPKYLFIMTNTRVTLVEISQNVTSPFTTTCDL